MLGRSAAKPVSAKRLEGEIAGRSPFLAFAPSYRANIRSAIFDGAFAHKIESKNSANAAYGATMLNADMVNPESRLSQTARIASKIARFRPISVFQNYS